MTMLPQTAGGFDYATIDAQAAAVARAAAGEIKCQLRATVASIIATGSELIKAKEALPHGRFGSWLEAEFRWTERTARNYIRAAEVFPSDKTEIVSDLPLSVVYKLAAPSTPEAVRSDIVQRLEHGERLSVADVSDAVENARAAERQANAEAKLSPQQRRRKAVSKAARQAELERIQRQDQERQAAAHIRARRLFEALGPGLVHSVLDALSQDTWRVIEELRSLAGRQEAP